MSKLKETLKEQYKQQPVVVPFTKKLDNGRKVVEKLVAVGDSVKRKNGAVIKEATALEYERLKKDCPSLFNA